MAEMKPLVCCPGYTPVLDFTEVAEVMRAANRDISVTFTALTDGFAEAFRPLNAALEQARQQIIAEHAAATRERQARFSAHRLRSS